MIFIKILEFPEFSQKPLAGFTCGFISTLQPLAKIKLTASRRGAPCTVNRHSSALKSGPIIPSLSFQRNRRHKHFPDKPLTGQSGRFRKQ
jgi:hypothetical protein